MRKTFLTGIIMTALMLTGCALSTTTTNVLQDKTVFNPIEVKSIKPFIDSANYKQRANNLFVIFDASASSTEDYQGEYNFKANNLPSKLEVQREILHRINRTLTASHLPLPLTTGLRSFGYGNCNGKGYTHLHQPSTNYTENAFHAAIDDIACSHGRSHLAEAILAAGDDLANTKGNIALLIVSDGFMLDSQYSFGPDSETAIAKLKEKFGDRLCVFNIWTGQESEQSGRDALANKSKIANGAYCGQPDSVSAGKVGDTDGLQDFVRALLLAPVPKAPVTDCLKPDTDGDGVNDCIDKCPNTIKDTPVNEYGCWIVDIKFDNDKDIINAHYFAKLNQLADDLDANFSHLTIEVQGHTSNTASAAHNMNLSIRRANAVANYLNKRLHGPHKLIPRGYGLTKPIDTNETAAGRANNRRVQLEIL